MARLPVPGSDDGEWGQILNEYLSVSHDDAGVLKSGVVSKSTVGLGNVDNTADIDKPISTAQQSALNVKANTADLAVVASSGDYSDLSNVPTIPTNNNQLANGAGYITDYTVTAQDVADAGGVTTTGNQTINGVKTFNQSAGNGAVRSRHLTVLPNPGRSGSASLFLDNEAGQIWEFFANSGGSFGVYNGTSYTQPMSVLPDAKSGGLTLDQYGAVVDGRLYMGGQISNVDDGTSSKDAVNKRQLDNSSYKSVITQNAVAWTITGTDHNKVIRFTSASPVAVTIPTDASNDLPDGFCCTIFAEGAGGVSLSTTGVTLAGNNPNSSISQNDALSLIKTASANTWIVLPGAL